MGTDEISQQCCTHFNFQTATLSLSLLLPLLFPPSLLYSLPCNIIPSKYSELFHRVRKTLSIRNQLQGGQEKSVNSYGRTNSGIFTLTDWIIAMVCLKLNWVAKYTSFSQTCADDVKWCQVMSSSCGECMPERCVVNTRTCHNIKEKVGIHKENDLFITKTTHTLPWKTMYNN